MSFRIEYKPLIDIKIDHDYFLDYGITKFENLSDDEQKVQRASYRISDFLSITPTLKTRQCLVDHKIILRQLDDGFTLLANVDQYTASNGGATVFCPKIQPSKDLMLTFELRFTDAYYRNYTDSIEDEKNSFFYFSNTRPDGEDNSLPIFFKNKNKHTKFLLKPETSRSIMFDIITNEIAPINSLGLENIVLIKEEEIEEPENAALLNTYIASKKSGGLIGYFRFGINGNGGNDILTDTNVEIPDGADEELGCLPDQVPSPIVNFENRKTFWRYIKLDTNEIFTTKKVQPLTKNGFVELKPNKLEPKLSNVFILNPGKDGVRIEEDKIYSEIFI